MYYCSLIGTAFRPSIHCNGFTEDAGLQYLRGGAGEVRQPGDGGVEGDALQEEREHLHHLRGVYCIIAIACLSIFIVVYGVSVYCTNLLLCCC